MIREFNSINNIPAKIEVKVRKSGWLKRSYNFIADNNTIAELSYPKSYQKKAIAAIGTREFSIRQRGFWKQFIEIASSTDQLYNMKIEVSWRGKMRITDDKSNTYIFKSASIWKNKWAWFDRYERRIIEIRSRTLSSRKRGQIEIKDNEMKDPIFWIIVSWFVILSSESESASAA
jgi:hypothetical protein